jgi:multiple sugar transport system ATP-binding protein
MASLELKNVSKVFRSKKDGEVYAVTNLDLAVAEKELLVLLGPSGCGKTTTLRLIAGLDELTAGTISMGGVVVNEVRPKDRDVAMIFQRDALYPHMTAFENMAFGLKLRGVAKADVETRVRALAATLGIAPLLDRRPGTMSGGQRQRVALGRALVRNPKVLLLDEPLSNLDAPLRAQMRGELSRLHAQWGGTMLYVTHDQSEALALGQRVAVMRDGALQQVAESHVLYRQPANLFVAEFFGSPPMNIFRGRIVAREGDFAFQENNPGGAATGLRLELPLSRERGERLIHFAEGNMVLGIRPEHISIIQDAVEEDAARIPVQTVEWLGAEALVYLATGAHTFIARTSPTQPPKAGERLPLQFEMNEVLFFNPASGSIIL